MAEPIESTPVESAHVSCGGGEDALGRPRVYLQIKPEAGEIECLYCSRRYVLKQGVKANAESH